jgi:chromosomal replication initiation ATPase DnaA
MSDQDLAPILIDPRPAGGLRHICNEVATHYEITPDELLGPSRHRRVSHPRQAFMFAARSVTWSDGKPRYSLPQIGNFLKVHHATVLFGIRQHQRRLRDAASTGASERVDETPSCDPKPQITSQ